MNTVNDASSTDESGNSLTIIDDQTPFLGKDASTAFYHKGIKYKTLAHYIECQKALMMQVYDTFHAANKANTMNRLYSTTKHMTVDYEKWYRSAERNIKQAVLSKFSQNYGALSALTSTGSSWIVYADKDDGYWGNGLARENPANTDQTNWPGQNKLGTIMMEVRDQLKA